MTQLPASWWLTYAAVGGILAGQIYLFAKVPLAAGGGARTLLRAIRSRMECLVVIIAVDAFGGLLTAASMLFVQATGPGRVADLIRDVPWLGWLVVGVAGPIVSDRLLTGSIVRGRFESAIGSEQIVRGVPDSHANTGSKIGGTAWRLRGEAVSSIQSRVTILLQGVLLREVDRLRSTAHALIEHDPDRSRAALVRLVNAMNDAQTFPPTVMAANRRLGEFASSGGTSVALQKALVRELIDSQSWAPLEVLAELTV